MVGAFNPFETYHPKPPLSRKQRDSLSKHDWQTSMITGNWVHHQVDMGSHSKHR